MIDWVVLNQSYPKAVAFAIDDVGMARLFSKVPRYMANRWADGGEEIALGLTPTRPSSPASTLMVKPGYEPPGYVSNWPPAPPGPEDKPAQVVQTATAYKSMAPAPEGVEVPPEQVMRTTAIAPGVPMPQPQNTNAVTTPAPATDVLTRIGRLEQVLREVVKDLPADKRQRLIALLPAGE